MNILHFFGPDEYKQQQISKFIVEGAILQFITSFLAFSLYLFTNVEPLFLLLAPFAVFLFYTVLRYMTSGIEFSDVFTKAEYDAAKKRNRLRAIGVFFMLFICFMIATRQFVDAFGISILATLITVLLDRISLKKSYKKNQALEKE